MMHNTKLLLKHCRRVFRSYLATGDEDTLRAHDVAMFYYAKMFAVEAAEQIKSGESSLVMLLGEMDLAWGSNSVDPEIMLINAIDLEPPPIIAYRIDRDSKPNTERNRKKGKGKRW